MAAGWTRLQGPPCNQIRKTAIRGRLTVVFMQRCCSIEASILLPTKTLMSNIRSRPGLGNSLSAAIGGVCRVLRPRRLWSHPPPREWHRPMGTVLRTRPHGKTSRQIAFFTAEIDDPMELVWMGS